jgi:hypothetical protein
MIKDTLWAGMSNETGILKRIVGESFKVLKSGFSP